MAAVRSALVTLKDGRTRRYRSKQERRQIVEESMKPGASVALVARAHDVNTNQLFQVAEGVPAGPSWRRCSGITAASENRGDDFRSSDNIAP